MKLFENKKIDYEEFSVGEGSRSLTFAHLSDLHFPREEVDPSSLLHTLEEKKADAVLFTGDLVCRSRPLDPRAFDFLKELSSRFPVFFAEGNHEASRPDREEISKRIRSCGVNVVTGTCSVYEGVAIGGASDDGILPDFGKENYRILLLHRPERARRAIDMAGPDLVLSGHAHGGQMRLFGRGVFAPGQGLFPKYTSGLYDMGKAKLLVSRGLGRSRFPTRINDPPHLPILTLFY